MPCLHLALLWLLAARARRRWTDTRFGTMRSYGKPAKRECVIISGMTMRTSRSTLSRGVNSSRQTVEKLFYAVWHRRGRVLISRSGSRMTESRTDAYGYNDRNELVSGTKSGGSQSPATEYEYSYDDIGNRLSSLDLGTNRTYIANSLNQYTQISNLCDSRLAPFGLVASPWVAPTLQGRLRVSARGIHPPVRRRHAPAPKASGRVSAKRELRNSRQAPRESPAARSL